MEGSCVVGVGEGVDGVGVGVAGGEVVTAIVPPGVVEPGAGGTTNVCVVPLGVTTGTELVAVPLTGTARGSGCVAADGAATVCSDLLSRMFSPRASNR